MRVLTLALSLLFAGCQIASPPATVAPAPQPVSAVASDRFWPADGKFPVPGRTSSWSGFRELNAQRRALFAERRELDRNAIVFVGDSITQGWNTLEQDFAGLGVKVANRGIGGDTTPNLVYRLQDDVLALRPRGLVILIGTNDLAADTSPVQIAANLRVMLERIRASDPTMPIVWCLVMPRGADEDFPTRIRDLNARIVALARSDPHSTLCDTFTPLARPDGTSKPEDFNPDRLHLNAKGYAIWHEVLAPILAEWSRSDR
jgi:lysophospholipase L1-like esterase